MRSFTNGPTRVAGVERAQAGHTIQTCAAGPAGANRTGDLRPAPSGFGGAARLVRVDARCCGRCFAFDSRRAGVSNAAPVPVEKITTGRIFLDSQDLASAERVSFP